MWRTIKPEVCLERFRASPYRLRFELGGERFGMDSPVSRFVQAFGRARQVAHDLFEHAPEVLGLVKSWDDAVTDLFASAEDGFEALRRIGFRAPLHSEWREIEDEGEGEEAISFPWRAYDLSGDFASRDALIWCAVAYEMPITPKAPVRTYLADFRRDILLHVYDDRGMDVTALDPEVLRGLYRERADWLLDYDRERMTEAFGGSA